MKQENMFERETTMKTNAQWYMQLPEPYRMQAINNAERDNMLGNEEKCLSAALCAFPWDTTPQGYEYWRAVFMKAEEGEFERRE